MQKKLAVIAASIAAATATIGMLGSPVNDPRLSLYQMRCAQALSYFITQIPIAVPGAQVTIGEAHRPTWVATEYAKRGLGISTSLHTQRLAVDLMLFENGVYKTQSEDYKELADLWMTVGPAFGVVPAAGIYFNDGNHFSCAYGGRK